MENASAAFLTAVQRSMQVIRKALGANVIDPAHLSCAERRQHSGWLRREEENAAILALAKQGMAIKEIVRRTSKSRGLVRQVVRGGRTVAIIEAAVPALVTARNLMDRFHGMNQSRMSAELEPWITDAMPGLLGSFAKGIVQDRAAVHAALTQPWSNGQTEGQNTKLKLVKRQMYDRANLDLLRARLLGPT
jgi:transposase